jgi:hypothetical protein
VKRGGAAAGRDKAKRSSTYCLHPFAPDSGDD